jgi:predicted ATPase/class 3 adenylate cyclase
VRVSTGDPPSGVVTFLFTDIEGSTRRWEADAEAMRAALSKHDQVLQTAIQSHDGFLFSHTGDGVVAAFASPRSAADAAVTAQLALELPVRMGIATGEAELRDGDYFGTVLNRAARVMAAGHGGQVLVADTTAGLLSGVDLVDLGPRRLRDIPNPITVFQLRAPGLRTDFPVLRTLEQRAGNLRPQTAPLIGRDAKIADIVAAVRAHRLVTLTGVGGVGKTKLALRVASELADEFVDGVWVFELAAVTDPAAVADAVAAVLGITPQSGKTVSESIAVASQDRARLFVFDNCEHVVDAAAGLVEAILAASASVKILATSREGLGIAEERMWRVPCLDDEAAVELFVERAQGAASGPLGDDSQTIREVCRRLDGIPLAIELAASRMASMTAAEVRDRLDDRFKLLVGSRRGLERHQTLRQAVAWSYDLLEDAEKSLLERCAVFAGGFDLESACVVAGYERADQYVVLDLLDALVRKSLLVADRTAERTRFSTLETIRQFAEEQLNFHGKAGEVRSAHAHYFAGREPDILALWDSARQRDAYKWCEVEFANLRAAFRWAADHDDLDTAVSVALCAHFLGIWIEQYEPVGWVEELIDPAAAIGHRRLAHLYVAAAQSYAGGRVAEAVDYIAASEQMTQSGDFDPLPYEVQSSTGVVYSVAGQSGRWVDLCRRVLAEQVGPHTVTRACLSIALYLTGKRDEARVAAAGLLAEADSAANPNTACFALLGHGGAYVDADPAAAYDVYRRALVIARDSGNRQLECAVAVMLCTLTAANRGDSLLGASEAESIDAFEYLAVTIRRYHDAGSVSFLHNPLAILSTVFDRLGYYDHAAIISGFAAKPMAIAGFPQINETIAHLRDVLGDENYESLANTGKSMTAAAVVTYAFDGIEQARAATVTVSK